MWEELLKLDYRYYILGYEFGSSSPMVHGTSFNRNFPLVKKTIEELYEKMMRSDLLKPQKTKFRAVNYIIYFINIGGSKLSSKYSTYSSNTGRGYDVGFELDIPNNVIEVRIWNPEDYVNAQRNFELTKNTVDLIYNWIEERVNININTGKRGRDD
tara:strand:+ start:1073 stop:1540 length:468 start_codon:yes stop_codon:yes gene_type:complete